MEFIEEVNAAEYLINNESYLLKDESINNLLLGLPLGIVKSNSPNQNSLFVTIKRNSFVCGQAIRTSPDKALILSAMDESALSFLANELKNRNVSIIGAIAPIETSKKFASMWNTDNNIVMHQGVYELERVIHPDYQGGEMILAKEEHYEIVKEYSYGFVRDCFPTEFKKVEAEEAAKRNIKNGTMFLWLNEAGEIVSMAANNRQSKNGATISWVYTPPQYRGNGYASKIVASLSQHALDNGKTICNLFTDLLNPTSNSIYQKVGYKKIGESMHFNFN